MLRAILATNFNELNRHILSDVPEIEAVRHDIETQLEALECVREARDIDIILLTDMLRGDKGLAEFLETVIEEKDSDTRLYYLASEYPEELSKTLARHGISCFRKGSRSLESFISAIVKDEKRERDQSVLVKTKIVRQVEYRKEVHSVFREVVAVYSPLSQGASCVAAHLAATLAGSGGYRVCLADFNPLKPAVRDIFDAGPGHPHTLSDALEAVVNGGLTTRKLDEIAKQSRQYKNLELVYGIYDFNDYYSSKTEQYEEVINKLKLVYDYVIIDTHSWYDVLPTDAALRLADRVLLPVMGLGASISGLNRYIESFDKYNDFNVGKFKAVVNRYGPSDPTCFEIAARLEIPVAGYISEFREMRDGNCFGNRKAANEFAALLNGMGIAVKKKGGLKDVLKRKKKEGASVAGG